MRYSPLSWRRLLPLAILAAVGALALAGPGAQAGPAEPSAGPGTNAASYLGRWNYDQPDLDGTRNMAAVRCPAGSTGCVGPGTDGGPLAVPQIGDIVFSEGSGGTVVGRTNVGCTWHFAVGSGSLELAPGGQYCFNEVSGVGYTINSWQVTVRGDRQLETIRAVSHRPEVDYDFVLEDGHRTRATEPSGREATLRFGGTWEYTPADPATRVNMVAVHEVGPSGEQFDYVPRSGVVDITAGSDGTLTARDADGCAWTMVARGNTAQLTPETQTCRLLDSTVILSSWTIASDGRHQSSMMRGLTERGSGTVGFLLLTGDLHRSTHRPPSA